MRRTSDGLPILTDFAVIKDINSQLYTEDREPRLLDRSNSSCSHAIRFSEREAAPTVTLAIDRADRQALIENLDTSG